MTDRNRELVPDNWSLVRERALTTGLCWEGCYSEHPDVCRWKSGANSIDVTCLQLLHGKPEARSVKRLPVNRQLFLHSVSRQRWMVIFTSTSGVAAV